MNQDIFKNSIIHNNIKKKFEICFKLKETEMEEKLNNCKDCREKTLFFKDNYLTDDKDSDFYYLEVKNNIYKSIFRDCYYWLITKINENIHGYRNEIWDLSHYFEINEAHINLIENKLIDICEEIAISDLIDLCTYHSVWLHYFCHNIYKNNDNMLQFDNLSQSDHVNRKNMLHALIYLKFVNPKRKDLLNEIKDFNLRPPLKSNGICGFEYKVIKYRFENNLYQK